MLEFYYIELDPLIKTNSGKNHICWAIVNFTVCIDKRSSAGHGS